MLNGRSVAAVLFQGDSPVDHIALQASQARRHFISCVPEIPLGHGPPHTWKLCTLLCGSSNELVSNMKAEAVTTTSTGARCYDQIMVRPHQRKDQLRSSTYVEPFDKIHDAEIALNVVFRGRKRTPRFFQVLTDAERTRLRTAPPPVMVDGPEVFIQFDCRGPDDGQCRVG